MWLPAIGQTLTLPLLLYILHIDLMISDQFMMIALSKSVSQLNDILRHAHNKKPQMVIGLFDSLSFSKAALEKKVLIFYKTRFHTKS